MPRALVILCRIIGILSFLTCLVLLADRFVKPRGYAEMAVEDFGTPERVAQLTQLYQRAQATPAPAELAVVDRGGMSGSPWIAEEQIVTTRLIPASWMPEDIGVIWRHPSGGSVSNSSALAYYDARDRLLGIQFAGSRYGAWLSEDRPLLPTNYQSLRILSRGRLWIIGAYVLAD